MNIQNKKGQVCSAMGRNGPSEVHGIEAFVHDRLDEDNNPYQSVEIVPVNSRGTTTKCSIEMPLDTFMGIYFQIMLADEDAEIQHNPGYRGVPLTPFG